ncbi:unnamed protein product [Sympodiomycopsis kandeliae]
MSVAPAIPDRPSTLSSTNSLGTGADPYGTGSSMYNRTGMNSYGGGYGSTMGGGYSPYSRMGGYGGYGMGGYGGYGGMGGYGSGYGGMGGYGGGYGGMGMGGYGGMGMGMGMGGPGMPGMPGQEMSLTQRMESGTQATFELISSIVGAFGGFAQMLESTFMATHSSFFAMVGVADQFASLRNYLGQVLSIFALARYMKNLLLRLTGRAPAVDLNAKDFQDFATSKSSGSKQAAKPSKRPLVVFFLAVVGLPYLMGKLVKLITAKQEAERLRLEAQGQAPGQQQGQHLPGQQGGGMIQNEPAIDPSKLSFVRALYKYDSSDPLELSLKQNDIVAILSKVDPQTGAESTWWRGRTRDGRIGWFPSTYVESLETAKERAARTAATASSTNGTTKEIEAAPNTSNTTPQGCASTTSKS